MRPSEMTLTSGRSETFVIVEENLEFSDRKGKYERDEILTEEQG
jgi:hypothetical protein